MNHYLSDVTENFFKQINNELEKIVVKFQDKYDVSYDCAVYFLSNYFNINIDITTNKYTPHILWEDKPIFNATLTISLKPVEELLQIPRNNDYELELITKKGIK